MKTPLQVYTYPTPEPRQEPSNLSTDSRLDYIVCVTIARNLLAFNVPAISCPLTIFEDVPIALGTLLELIWKIEISASLVSEGCTDRYLRQS